MQATSVQVVYSSKQCKNQYDKKVLMSESGYLKPFYDEGILGVGGHSFACIVSDKDEGDKIIKLLNSKLYRFYIEVNKWSGFHNKEVLKDLPNIINEMSKINDETIYNYFKLSKDEINIIEEEINKNITIKIVNNVETEIKTETKTNNIDYDKYTVKELRKICKELGIKGYSNKKKQSLLNY
jgi:hypothetical protein